MLQKAGINHNFEYCQFKEFLTEYSLLSPHYWVQIDKLFISIYKSVQMVLVLEFEISIEICSYYYFRSICKATMAVVKGFSKKTSVMEIEV